ARPGISRGRPQGGLGAGRRPGAPRGAPPDPGSAARRLAAPLPSGEGGLRMRVIAGRFRSRRLRSLTGPALRPTSDRLRETLFNILSPLLEGCRFLDLFAGTGAVGIEALSRGAALAVFVESHPSAARLIGANLDALGITDGARVLN